MSFKTSDWKNLLCSHVNLPFVIGVSAMTLMLCKERDHIFLSLYYTPRYRMEKMKTENELNFEYITICLKGTGMRRHYF
jgi:hypothetical protein